MDIVGDTALQFAPVLWQLRPPRPSFTAIVKATFAIAEDGACTLLPEQPPVSGEDFHDDDPRASLRIDTDFALLKPRGEYVLAGTAYPPGARPAPTALVQVRVGPLEKSIAVIGDRHWARTVLGWEPSAPAPFRAMPLRPEKAFGGPDIPANPVGVGTGPRGERIALPNLERRSELVRAITDRPAPAFMTPRSASWPTRIALAGTCDERWKKTQWPWFPVDFNPSYCNSAPLDQQLDGYWRGDEEIVLSGLHPTRTTIRARLPGRRARVFLRLRERSHCVFRDLAMRLDTINIDTDVLQVTCVWRGVIEVADLADIDAVFVVDEPLDATDDLAIYEARMHDCARAQGISLEEEDDDETAIAIAPSRPRAGVAERVAVRAPLAPAPGRAPIFAPSACRTPSPPQPGHLRDMVRRRLVYERSLRGMDLTGADLSELDLRDIDLGRVVLTGASLRGARIDGASLADAVLLRTDLRAVSAVRTSFARAVLDEACFDDATLDGATLARCQAEGASFERARLRRVIADEAELTGAMLRGASLVQAGLAKAKLSNAICDDADFTASTLVDATLSGARANAAIFDRADLSGLRAGGPTSLVGARFRDAIAAGAKLAGADLTRADLRRAMLHRADLGKSLLTGALLDGADLRDARLSGANLSGARLVYANAMSAVFEGADLTHADLRGASCYQAELRDADTRGMRTELAYLVGTKLEEAR